jgi:hypothetical protein
LKTETYPFKAAVKGEPGGAFFPFRKDIKEIAAPQTEARIELGAVFGYPPLLPFYPLSHEQERGGGLSYGLQEGPFLLAFEAADMTAHDPQMGEGLADVCFSFCQDPLFAAQQVDGKFTLFQDG